MYRLLEHGELVKDNDEKWCEHTKKWVTLNPWDRGVESYHGEHYHKSWLPVRRKISQDNIEDLKPAHNNERDSIPDYDSGTLNDHGGGKVQWWQDYIRHEVGACNDYWRSATEPVS